METKKNFWMFLAVLALAFALVGCSDGAGPDDNGGIGLHARQEAKLGQSPLARQRLYGQDRSEERHRAEDRRREAKIGGFSVQGPNDEDISIPEAEADPSDVAAYTESVRPVVEDGTRGFSSLVGDGSGLKGDTLNLGLSAGSVKEAMEANRGAVEDLQNLDVPSGLGGVNEALVGSRKQAEAAYADINQAFANGASSGTVSEVAKESIPEIEYSDAQTRAILQELERASGAS